MAGTWAVSALTEREPDVLARVARGVRRRDRPGAVGQRGHRQGPPRARADEAGLRDRVRAVALAYESGPLRPEA